MEMDDILGLSRPKPAGDAGRIKDMVRQRFGLADDVTLMVSELRCHEDGCPDVETVIAVMAGGAQTESWKISWPMAEVGADNIAGIRLH
jgi:hypothetical protein